MAKNLEMTILLDFYGDMLTPKQRDFLDYYYNQDYSLAEIAANVGITRQGVRDAIKRAEAKLLSMEEKLGLVRRNREMAALVAEIRRNAEKAAVRAYQVRAPREIIAAASDIDTLAERLEEYLK